jgi:hypothetical protein
LSKLGVDAVTMTGVGALSVDLGGAGTLNNLPQFGDNNVTLNVSDLGQLAQAAAAGHNLHLAGIDHVQINLAQDSSAAAAQAGSNFNAELSALLSGNALQTFENQLSDSGLALSTIDLGGFGVDGAVTIDQFQALELINAGLHFAINDGYVSLNAAQATQLGTSLKDLQHLGVDTVMEAGHSLQVDLGVGSALSAEHIARFDHAADVTLNLATGAQLSEVEALAQVLADAGIDHVALAQSHLGNAEADAAIHTLMDAGIDFKVSVLGSAAKAPVQLEQVVQHFVNEGVDLLAGMLDPNAQMGELVKALSQSGIHGIEIDKPAAVVIGDPLAAALHDSGMLQAMPEARVEIDAGDAARMQTSLKAMADLGVDHVVSSAAAGSHIAMALGTDIRDIASLLQSFISDTDHVSTKSIFDHAVDLYVGNAVGTETLQTLLESGLGSKLADLGISKVVAQDLPPVQLIGAVPEHTDPFMVDITHLKTTH